MNAPAASSADTKKRTKRGGPRAAEKFDVEEAPKKTNPDGHTSLDEELKHHAIDRDKPCASVKGNERAITQELPVEPAQMELEATPEPGPADTTKDPSHEVYAEPVILESAPESSSSRTRITPYLFRKRKIPSSGSLMTPPAKRASKPPRSTLARRARTSTKSTYSKRVFEKPEAVGNFEQEADVCEIQNVYRQVGLKAQTMEDEILKTPKTQLMPNPSADTPTIASRSKTPATASRFKIQTTVYKRKTPGASAKSKTPRSKTPSTSSKKPKTFSVQIVYPQTEPRSTETSVHLREGSGSSPAETSSKASSRAVEIGLSASDAVSDEPTSDSIQARMDTTDLEIPGKGESSEEPIMEATQETSQTSESGPNDSIRQAWEGQLQRVLELSSGNNAAVTLVPMTMPATGGER